MDTAAKRFSLIGFGKVYLPGVYPTGTIDTAARAAFLHLYSGISLPKSVSLEDILDAIEALSASIRPAAFRRERVTNEELQEQIVILKNELRDIKKQFRKKENF